LNLERSSLLTLPVLGAFAVMLGVGLQRLGASLWVALGVAALALPVIANVGSRFTARVRVVLTVALLLCPLAWWRANIVRNAPDVLAEKLDQHVTLEGEFDGRFLNTPDARVLIQPRRALQSGQYRVTGRLELPGWYRNPGAFDLGAWLESRGVRYALRVQKSVRLPDTLLERVRRHARAGVTAGLPPTESALMLGVALGDADDFSSLPDTPEGLTWREVFSRSGLTHVMALSGQQITLLVAALSLLLARLKLWRYPVLIAVLGAYLVVVGFSPSVTRAVMMGVSVLASLWLGRGKLEVASTLGLSAVLTLSLEPRWLFDLGWQLSFLAVLGMMLFTPPILALFPTVSTPGKWLIGGVAATLGASALTLPLTASSFGVIAPFSVFANLVAEVLMTALVPLGFLASLAGESIGALVNLPTRFLATALLETARVFSVAPVVQWGNVGALGFVAFYAGIAALLLALRGSLRAYRAFVVVLLGVIVTGAAGQARGAQILYLDVGQGDSTLIRLPGADILVDGGGTPSGDFDIGRNVVVPALRALGVRNLIVIATHADSDHVEGLEAVLDEIPVSTLVIGHDKVPGTDAFWDRVAAAATRNRVPTRAVRRGEIWTLGAARLVFHGPRPNAFPDDNDNSVAFALEFGSRRALFLGDTPDWLEREMNPGAVNVLKAAHHGSRFSTSEELMRRTRPEIAVLSSGRDNNYGHPSRTVLQRLERFGTRVYRTDRDGAITYDLNTGIVTVTHPNAATGLPGTPGETRP
jgi:competence protein ComEC